MPGKNERNFSVQVSFELGTVDPLSCELSFALCANSLIEAYDAAQSYLIDLYDTKAIKDIEIWKIEEFSSVSQGRPVLP